MTKRRRRSAELQRVETTSGKKFSETVTKTGRTIYRVNGRFVSAKAFRAASSSRHVVERTSARTDVDVHKPARTFRDMTVKDGNVWRAGEDAARYMPWLKEGDILSKAEQKTLREIRLGQRNYWSFARLKSNRGKSSVEIQRDYEQFMREIETATSGRKRRVAVDRFWSTSYAGKRSQSK